MTSPGDNTRDLSKSPLNVEIPAELKTRLVAYCEETDLSQAAVARLALNAYLTSHGHPKKSTR